MGGKKKKSSAATPTAAPSAATAAGRTGAAAAGNGVAEEAKKQPGSNKPTKPAKENKSKGRNSVKRFRNIASSIQQAALTLPLTVWELGTCQLSV